MEQSARPEMLLAKHAQQDKTVIEEVSAIEVAEKLVPEHGENPNDVLVEEIGVLSWNGVSVPQGHSIHAHHLGNSDIAPAAMDQE